MKIAGSGSVSLTYLPITVGFSLKDVSAEYVFCPEGLTDALPAHSVNKSLSNSSNDHRKGRKFLRAEKLICDFTSLYCTRYRNNKCAFH